MAIVVLGSIGTITANWIHSISLAKEQAIAEQIEVSLIAEEERLAVEKKAEEERIAEERAEEDRIIAKKKAEEERLAQEQQIEEERLAQQMAEEQRIIEEEYISNLTYGFHIVGLDISGCEIVYDMYCDATYRAIINGRADINADVQDIIDTVPSLQVVMGTQEFIDSMESTKKHHDEWLPSFIEELKEPPEALIDAYNDFLLMCDADKQLGELVLYPSGSYFSYSSKKDLIFMNGYNSAFVRLAELLGINI